MDQRIKFIAAYVHHSLSITELWKHPRHHPEERLQVD